MTPVLHVLYRGPLSSCNYECGYCPFAKHRSPPDELARDRAGLDRFVEWATGLRDRDLTVLFTPWGEALVRRWYRTAIVELSRSPRLRKVAVQTNLSAAVDWLEEADVERVGLWCTFHPGETTLDRFLARCRDLDALGVRYSVGLVGLPEHRDVAVELRRRLDPSVYVWINAYKSGGPGGTDPDLTRFYTAIDPHHPTNDRRHVSLGRSCRAGASAITVDGDGDVRRCHFVEGVLGNLYRQPLEEILGERRCPNATCGCHIGYVHLDHLGLHEVYGEGLPERIPVAWPP